MSEIRGAQRKAGQQRPLQPIGWRELVGLPQLGLSGVPAKIDTGARTSSLHATILEEFERDGQDYLRFAVDFPRGGQGHVCEAVKVAWRAITSSNGETQRRAIIKTPLTIGELTFRTEISLANRSDMKFPMLIGRASLRRRFIVDAGHSWLQTPDRDPAQGYKT